MVGCSFALADTCHNNICIDTKGNTYIKNNTNITNELMYGLSGVLLSGNTQTGTLHTGNVQTGALLSGSILTGKNTITTGTTNALTNFKPTGSNTS